MSNDTEPESPIDKLRYMMVRLRDPDTGCPWDLKQDFASIAPYTVEEAYEVADAIDRGDYVHLKEELGDLLLQVIFHSQMANEAGHFDFDQVAEGLLAKMVRRHPHVFPQGDLFARFDDQTIASDQVKHNWENIKAAEKAEKGDTADASALAGVPANMPALIRSQKLQRKAAKVGFDWPEAAMVLAKYREEIEELEHALAADDTEAIADELGDLLFTNVNLIRKLGLDSETVLRAANLKFEARFREMETLLEQASADIGQMDVDTLEGFWQRAKQRLRGND